MSVRWATARGLFVTLTAVVCFALGAFTARYSMMLPPADQGAPGVAMPNEDGAAISEPPRELPDAGEEGERDPGLVGASGIEEVKRQLQLEMGLLPVRLLRERARSFVELNAWDNRGRSRYATAGYLGNGYFITVKHGVVALEQPEDGSEPRRINRITLRHRDRVLGATLVDVGNARVEVHPGDWAILKVKDEIDLPPLPLDAAHAFEFATPIFRLGNDYSRGIVLSTGYAGQRTRNGLVTCLTDGHPGASGGGVLDQAGTLVGMAIGRMRDDYRFSFILPLRAEMFRKVPGVILKTAQTTE